jgi:AraC-like DNA-binding protein
LHHFVRATMQRPGRSLLVLHRDFAFLQRVKEAAEGVFQLRELADWRGLERTLAGAGPGALVVVDPYHGSPRGSNRLAPELRMLRHSFPSAVVLAAFSYRERGYRDIWALSTWGVAEVLVLEEESTRTAVQQLLQEVRNRSLRRLLDGVRLPHAGRARPVLDAAAEVVASGGQARDLARALSVSRATLLRWCTRAELPPPRRLLLWIRLLHAARLLDDPGHSVISVARSCGYASDNALRNALQAAGVPAPTELRLRGAFEVVCTRFQREVDDRSFAALAAERSRRPTRA